ncbi:hypothetical protein DFJ74DRAFT_765524 [Hyaloraphidium curvatum]|nr:hypothetical protein DFJ74DRAFT_765524 [Hyaloraphidium curvatum]
MAWSAQHGHLLLLVAFVGLLAATFWTWDPAGAQAELRPECASLPPWATSPDPWRDKDAAQHLWGNASTLWRARGGGFIDVGRSDQGLPFVTVEAPPARYPLDAAMLERSYTPAGITCRLGRFFSKLASGEKATIVVIGGSMTAGHECGMERCAWPRYLAPWFRQMNPAWKVEVKNVAEGGCGLDCWLTKPFFAELAADLFIVDLSVNSQAMPETTVTELMDQLLWDLYDRQGEPAILVAEAFRTCSDQRWDCDKHCSRADQGSVGDQFYCKKWWHAASYEAAVAKHYRLPIASYRDAVWPVLEKPPADLKLLWNGLSHPDALGHELFSDVVKYALARELQRYCRSPPDAEADCGFRPTMLTQRRCPRPCREPATAMSAANRSSFEPAREPPGRWRFFADRPNKPGWIFTSNASAEPSEPAENAGAGIAFDVVLGSRRSLEVTFMRSYANFGPMLATVTAADGMELSQRVLNGTWADRYSLPFNARWLPMQEDGSCRGPRCEEDIACLPRGVREGDRVGVSLAPLPDAVVGNLTFAGGGRGYKFKLLSIVAC